MKIKVKKIKRFIIVLICIVSVFCFSFSVSALKVNSLDIKGTRGEIWDVYGSGRRFTTTPFEDYNLGICYPFDIYGLNFDVTGSPLATYTYFSTYGVNYGTLTLSYYADNGNIYYDSFNGLYDLNGNKLASFVVNDGIYTLSYTGDMLSEFLLQGYFTYDNGDSELYVIADITFTPTNGDIINNQNENTDKIIGNQNSNSQAIQNNQDKNTDKIIQNQEENQSEITNGWQQEANPDTSVTDDYGQKDAELQEATKQGRSETVSIFNSFGSLFQSDGHLYKGLLSVSAIFTEFLKIEWVGSILNFALAIGVFAFVIGTGSQVFRSAHEQREERKIDNISSDDERWLY